MSEKTVVMQRPMKSPALAGILSAFLPFGIGALYNEQRNKFFLQFAVFGMLVYALTRHGNGVVFGLGLAAFYFYQIIDNILSARAINAAAVDQPPAEGPAAAPLDAPAGSVFWGIVLIVLGVVLILANFEVILTWRTLGNYWPVAPILIGLKFVYDAAKSKKEK